MARGGRQRKLKFLNSFPRIDRLSTLLNHYELKQQPGLHCGIKHFDFSLISVT